MNDEITIKIKIDLGLLPEKTKQAQFEAIRQLIVEYISKRFGVLISSIIIH